MAPSPFQASPVESQVTLETIEGLRYPAYLETSSHSAKYLIKILNGQMACNQINKVVGYQLLRSAQLRTGMDTSLHYN